VFLFLYETMFGDSSIERLLMMIGGIRPMTRLLIATVAILMAAPVRAQLKEPQHAPLADQCVADLHLWANEDVKNEYLDAEEALDKSGAPDHSTINKLPIHELVAREHEMQQCKAVDPARKAEYSVALRFYLSVMDDRRMAYFARHPEAYEQLVKEDDAGIR
jgi:hypothetical protein